MPNIGTLFAGIGLEVDALQNDIRQVEKSFSQLATSTKKILNGVESSVEPLRRETRVYAKEIDSLAGSAGKAKTALGGISGSIIKGFVGANVIVSAARSIKNFVQESITAAAETEKFARPVKELTDNIDDLKLGVGNLILTLGTPFITVLNNAATEIQKISLQELNTQLGTLRVQVEDLHKASGQVERLNKAMEEWRNLPQPPRLEVKDSTDNLSDLRMEYGLANDAASGFSNQAFAQSDSVRSLTSQIAELNKTMSAYDMIIKQITPPVMEIPLPSLDDIQPDIPEPLLSEADRKKMDADLMSFKEWVDGIKILREQQIAALEILLQSNRLTASELDSVWSEYYDLQLENLADLQKGWRAAGLSQDRVVQLTEEFNAKLQAQKEDIDAWGMSWEKWFQELDEDTKKLAEAMSQSFEDNFFSAMEGEFNSFRDFVKAIVADITQFIERELARIFAQKLTRLILGEPDSGPTAGNIFGALELAEGGMVSRPTYALIGEAGPEVVVPLSRMDDPSFWEGIGLGNRGSGGPVNVHMTVVTPDLPAFRASQNQIMAEAQVRLGQAMRRNR